MVLVRKEERKRVALLSKDRDVEKGEKAVTGAIQFAGLAGWFLMDERRNVGNG